MLIETPIQIRFADVDALRHVNNICLQHYYDLGKSIYMREVLNMHHIWDGLGFIQANTNTNYLVPVYLEDEIVVTTCIKKIGTKSVTMYQEILDRNNREAKSNSTSIMVGFDVDDKLSIELLPEWVEAIRRHESF